jgi:DNA-binding response OmpR family regulator
MSRIDDSEQAVEGALRASSRRSGPLRVGLVDVDSAFLTVAGKRFDALGWEHRTLQRGVRPEALVRMRLHALVIDLALLGPDAWSYLESVAVALPGLAIIVCTGGASVAQRVQGLRLGADDWLAKPCHPAELAARIEAVMRRRRRSDAPDADDAIRAGAIAIRPDRFDASIGEQPLELTRREFELLHMLAAADGRVLEREEIYRRVWGYEMAHGDRSVDVFVRKLRQKLKQASPAWRYIHTHFGVGYRFAAEPADGRESSAEAEAAQVPGETAAPAAPAETAAIG